MAGFLLASSVLAGCGTDEASNETETPATSAQAVLSGDHLWVVGSRARLVGSGRERVAVSVPVRGTAVGAVAQSDGTLWVLTEQGELVRVEVSGRTRRLPLAPRGREPYAGPVVAGTNVWAVSGDTLYRVDVHTASVVATIPLGPTHPEAGVAMATGAGAVWVALDAGTLLRVDPMSDQVVARTTVTDGSVHDHASFYLAAGEQTVWVATDESNVLVAVDARTNRPSGNAKLAEAPIQLTLGHGALWAASFFHLFRIDPASGQVLQQVDLSAEGADYQFGIGDAGVWVADDIELAVHELDPATAARKRKVSVPLDGEDPLLEVTVGRDRVWVLDHDGRTLFFVDPSEGRIEGRFDLGDDSTSTILAPVVITRGTKATSLE